MRFVTIGSILAICALLPLAAWSQTGTTNPVLSSTCLVSVTNCSYNSPGSSPSCFLLNTTTSPATTTQQATYDDCDGAACSMCEAQQSTQGNICVSTNTYDIYNVPQCIPANPAGTVPCGTTYTSSCYIPKGDNSCFCNTNTQKQGGTCSFPTCTGTTYVNVIFD
jgi:hypothetical protein